MFRIWYRVGAPSADYALLDTRSQLVSKSVHRESEGLHHAIFINVYCTLRGQIKGLHRTVFSLQWTLCTVWKIRHGRLMQHCGHSACTCTASLQRQSTQSHWTRPPRVRVSSSPKRLATPAPVLVASEFSKSRAPAGAPEHSGNDRQRQTDLRHLAKHVNPRTNPGCLTRRRCPHADTTASRYLAVFKLKLYSKPFKAPPWCMENIVRGEWSRG